MFVYNVKCVQFAVTVGWYLYFIISHRISYGHEYAALRNMGPDFQKILGKILSLT